METSERDIVPLHKLQINKWYQLAKPLVISPSRSWNTDISQAVASLFREPHKLEHIFGTKGREGRLTEITVRFEKTDTDMATNKNGIYARNYWQINSRQELPEGWNTLFIDLEAREKMYAPPSENGSNKGGLFYRLGKKRFETLAEHPTLAPPYNREGLNTKYQKNPNAFKNFLVNQAPAPLELAPAPLEVAPQASSSSVGGKRKQRVTRATRKSLHKNKNKNKNKRNKRKQTRKHRLTHLYKFF